MTFVNMSRGEAVSPMQEAHTRMEELNGKHRMSASDQSEFDHLSDEFRDLQSHVRRLDLSGSVAQGTTQAGARVGLERGSVGDLDSDPMRDPRSAESVRNRNPWDLSEVRTFGRDPGEISADLRSRALSAIEAMPGASDRIRAAATDLVERHDTPDAKLARHALITSSPEYLRAFAKMARGLTHTMTPEESMAVSQAEQFRAMSLTDSAGGYLVPFQLDPTVIITSAGSRNDIRQAARTVIATGDTWNGVSSAAVSWSWDAEAAEVSDDATTFAQPSIPIYKAQGFVPISVEAWQDESNVTTEVGRLLAFGKESLEAEAFATGSGSGQPTGIVTALAASAGGASIVAAATDDTFALADVHTLHDSLPARYRTNASWLANNLIYSKIRQFDTNGGAGLWTTLGNGTPQQLLGRPVYEAEAMDGTVTTGSATANYVAIFGDLSNYVIADRIGLTVELVPHLFGSNRRPTGQRGWIAWYRVGADSVNDGGMRMLNVASAS